MDRKLAIMHNLSEEDLTNINIEILNGSGKTSNLTKVKTILEDVGFTISKTGTTNSTKKTSIINKNNVSEDLLSSIKNLLEVGAISSSNTESSSHITIILGKDFNN